MALNLRCVLGLLLAVSVTCEALRIANPRRNMRLRPPLDRLPSERCSRTQLGCDNGICIDLLKRCDGIDNCGDNTDESQCTGPVPPRPKPEPTDDPCYSTVCGRGQVCRMLSGRNCGRQPCTTKATCIDEGDLRRDVSTCRIGKPILMEDYSTLTCNSRDVWGCPPSAVCNIRVGDAPSVCCWIGSTVNNRNCPKPDDLDGRCQNYLRCLDDSMCPVDQMCCSDGCGRTCSFLDPTKPIVKLRPDQRCGLGEFQCIPTGRCISTTQKCNGRNDCGDNSDEKNCSSPPPPPKPTRPTRRNFRYGK